MLDVSTQVLEADGLSDPEIRGHNADQTLGAGRAHRNLQSHTCFTEPDKNLIAAGPTDSGVGYVEQTF